MATPLLSPNPDSSNTLEGELALQTDTRRPMRIGLWVLGLGFGGFMLWAALAPLDEGVPTQGTVSIDTKRKAVQHLNGGLITEILVHEGDMVEAGQVLARLDTSVTRANFEAMHQRYMGLSAMESRLIAEQSGATNITFTPEVFSSTDPMIQLQVSTQRALHTSRRAALDAELRGIQKSIQGQEAMLGAYAGQLTSNQLRLASLKDELGGLSELVKEGYAPRNRQMELERQVAATEGAITELHGNFARTRNQIAELQQRSIQRRQQQRMEADRELAQIRMELQAGLEKYKASAEEMTRTELRAPVTGQVVGLAIHTVGGVIQPAQKIMDIVPLDEYLLLESRIPPHLIDRVEPGQMADIRFNAFAHSPQLVVQGKLESVSHDLITDPATNIPYFLARISVTPEGMQTLGSSRRMQAGMPAEIIIKTGERSLLKYLLHPLVKRVAASMKEE
ncbi:MAG: HlyD family type I secretion periplasmic adaptor subunit [Rhodocyclaceae bacterium]